MAEIVVISDDPWQLTEKTTTIDRRLEFAGYLDAYGLPTSDHLCVISWRQNVRKKEDIFDREILNMRLWDVLYTQQPRLIVTLGTQATWILLGQRDLHELWGIPWACADVVVLPIPFDLMRHNIDLADQVLAGFEMWREVQGGRVGACVLPQA